MSSPPFSTEDAGDHARAFIQPPLGAAGLFLRRSGARCAGQSFRILSANAVTGAFDTVTRTLPAALGLTTTQSADGITVTTTHNSYAGFAPDADAAGLGRALADGVWDAGAAHPRQHDTGIPGPVGPRDVHLIAAPDLPFGLAVNAQFSRSFRDRLAIRPISAAAACWTTSSPRSYG